MLTMTIEQATGKEAPDVEDHYLYLIRDGETVFYVGQSIDPITRLSDHLGTALKFPGTGSDSLGWMICDNLPDSLGWIFELYTLADALTFIEEHATERRLASYRRIVQRRETEDERPYDLTEAKNKAEDAMIEHFRPCLNTARVHFDSPVPMQYLEKQLERNRQWRREFRDRERRK